MQPNSSRARFFQFLLAVAFLVSAAFPALGAGNAAAALGAQDLDRVATMVMAAVDNEVELAIDEENNVPGGPMRFAVALPAGQSITTDGTWEALDDGTMLWRLRIRSSGARNLNLGFSRYYMPSGGRLRLYPSAGEEYVAGPFTAADNKPHGELWTPVIPGDDIVVEVRVPVSQWQEVELQIGSVNHGYRGFHGNDNAEKSGSCNIDVVCPEGDAWRPQIRSVARLTLGGVDLCTGFMVNNTAQDLRPLFMTAFHCDVFPGNAASLGVYWNFQNSTCRNSQTSGNPGNGSLAQFQNGATWLADSAFSDYTLLELDSAPMSEYNVYWAGWDARDINPTSAVAVHHPQTEEKRISFENNPLTTQSYLCPDPPGRNFCQEPISNGSHFRVEDWDVGTTEGGSSGSPLFNPQGRVIGQLHGGHAFCGNNLPDWYGRMVTSWDRGLGAFLDPVGGGITRVLDGREGTVVGDDDDDDDDDGGMLSCDDMVPPTPCVVDSETLCLNGGRFQVKVDFRDFSSEELQQARVVDQVESDDSGLLYFFQEDNWEMLLKVLDGCSFNNHYWVFMAATTNVEYTLRVTDTTDGCVQEFFNPLGTSPPAVTDIEAFASCP